MFIPVNDTCQQNARRMVETVGSRVGLIGSNEYYVVDGKLWYIDGNRRVYINNEANLQNQLRQAIALVILETVDVEE